MSSMSRLVSRFVPQDVFDGDEADQLSLSRNEDYPGTIPSASDYNTNQRGSAHPIRLNSCITISSGIFGDTINGV
jgi:hypothetical protein